MASGSEAVHDHLSLTSGGSDPGLAQGAGVVGDEILRQTADPGDVTDTQFSPGCQGRSHP